MAAAKKASTRTRAPMSDEHKAALAEGRRAGRAVRSYLEALESTRPKRGRKRSPERIEQRIEAIGLEIPDADPLRRLNLIQERMDLEAERASLDVTEDLEALEADFVAHAAKYAASKGISYQAWRAIGVPAPVLKAAGITRGS